MDENKGQMWESDVCHTLRCIAGSCSNAWVVQHDIRKKSKTERDQAGWQSYPPAGTLLMEPGQKGVPNCPQCLLWRNRLPEQILPGKEKQNFIPSACLCKQEWAVLHSSFPSLSSTPLANKPSLQTTARDTLSDALSDGGWALRRWATVIYTLTLQAINSTGRWCLACLSPAKVLQWSRDWTKVFTCPGLRSELRDSPAPVLTFLYNSCCSFQSLHILCQLFLVPVFKEKSWLSVKFGRERSSEKHTIL